MKNDEIRAANRKALPKFLLLTLVGAVIGGIAGYCAARYGLDQLSGVLADAGAFFGARIAPWLMVAVAVITPVVCIPLYRRAKALLASWDGEDEDVSSVIDGKLSAALREKGSFVEYYFIFVGVFSAINNGCRKIVKVTVKVIELFCFHGFTSLLIWIELYHKLL